MEPDVYLRLVLDPIRLAVLGTAALGPVDADEVADRLEVPVRKVREAVGRLRRLELLDEESRLNREELQAIAVRLPQMEPADPEILAGSWSGEEAAVLSRFFEGSRLRSIPTHRGKRRVVLERLVQEFEPGLRYAEREVNARLQLVHPDYAALRRYLVDEGFLTRAEGVYWRTGGRYDPAPDGTAPA